MRYRVGALRVSRDRERCVTSGCDLCVLCTISVWRVPVARRPQTPSRSNFLSREALPLRAHGERGKALNTTGLRFIFFPTSTRYHGSDATGGESDGNHRLTGRKPRAIPRIRKSEAFIYTHLRRITGPSDVRLLLALRHIQILLGNHANLRSTRGI